MPLQQTRTNFDTIVSTASETFRKLLLEEKCIQVKLSDHSYSDKYLLVEMATRALLRAHLACLRAVGLSNDSIATCIAWADERVVTLRFDSTETCTFLREDKVDLEGPMRVTSVFGVPVVKHRTFTTVSKFVWCVRVKWQLSIFSGNDFQQAMLLCSNQCECEVVTSSKTSPPKVSTSERDSEDVDITWMFRHLTNFKIERDHLECRTPRRNPEIIGAFEQFEALSCWYSKIFDYFSESLFAFDTKDRELAKLDASTIFVPISPLFETLSLLDATIEEHQRSLETQTSAKGGVVDLFACAGLIGKQETLLLLVTSHVRIMIARFFDCVNYVEQLLISQLVAAIGKRVTSDDFTELLHFRLHQILRSEFQPLPMSYHVRRPCVLGEAFDTEGTLSIEDALGREVMTFVRSHRARAPMHFALNAGTKVSFHGERFVHGAVIHDFTPRSASQEKGPELTLSLRCRARPFCPLLLVLGRLASASELVPLHAVVLQNRDDLYIPLRLETIPSAQEFRDAIESLSPEQQRFCQAYRSLQLSHTLFAVCTIPLKPQLEAVLRLPYASLLKEIELCQHVMELFLQYQIASDLLSYDTSLLVCDEVAVVAGNLEVGAEVRVVRSNVDAIRNLIAGMRQAELDELAAAQRKAEEERRAEEERKKAEAAAERAREEQQRQKTAAALKYDTMLKLMLVGDTGVGKSTMRIRFLDDKFDAKHMPTIGAEFGTKTVEVNGKVLKLQIWDTAGEDRFKSVTRIYYRGSDAAIFVFDVTSEVGFGKVRDYFADFREQCNLDTHRVLVACKCLEPARVVSAERAQKLATELGMEYMECDAKANYNVDVVFETVARGAYRSKRETGSAPMCCSIQCASAQSSKGGFFSFGGGASSGRTGNASAPKSGAKSVATSCFSRTTASSSTSVSSSSAPAPRPAAASLPSSAPSQTTPSSPPPSASSPPPSSSSPPPSASSPPSSSSPPSVSSPSCSSVTSVTSSSSSSSSSSSASSKTSSVLASVLPNSSVAEEEEEDFTLLPSHLQEAEEEDLAHGVLRPTILHPEPTWYLATASPGAIPSQSAGPMGAAVNADEQAAMKRTAFALLDAVTRSGTLCLSEASLHVLMLPVHRFDASLMECVIEDNVNPVEPLERSSLRVASAVFNISSDHLLRKG